MRLKDTVFKRLGRDLWMYHTASPYKVRVNEETMARLSGLLGKRSGSSLLPDEEFLYEKLAARGMLFDAPCDASQLQIKQRSRLDAIELEFSGVCNLRCRHCFAAMTGKMMGSDIFDRILHDAAELDVITLILSGGEPLLNPLFVRSCRKAREQNLKLIVMTNGKTVDENIAGAMQESGVAEVVVSLDSFKEHHDRLRGHGAFESSVEGIRTMVRKRLPVFVTSMVTDLNIPFVEEFKVFCLKQLGVSGVRLSVVVPIGEAAKSSGQPDIRVSDANIRKVFHSACPDEESPLPPADDETARGFKCSAGRRQIFISADGLVYACHYFQNLGEPMGNLAEEPLETIYRRNIESGSVTSFDRRTMNECRRCPKFAECQGGCRARAKLLGGGFRAPDPLACRIYGVIPRLSR